MNDAPAIEMPSYKSHKTVHALKIKAIVQSLSTVEMEGGSWDLVPEDPRYPPVIVPHAWYVKHEPKAPGYLVVYEEGYRSWSPADVFEAGYALVLRIDIGAQQAARLPMHGPALLEKLHDVFTYHAPAGDMPVRYGAIRDAGYALAEMILLNTPPCADQTAAVRKVREAVMTANAAIALKGLV